MPSLRDEIRAILREEIAAQYHVGDEIEVTFDPTDLHFFDRNSGRRTGGAISANG